MQRFPFVVEVGRGDCLAHPFGGALRFGGFDARYHDSKLFAAQSCDEIRLASCRVQHASDLDEDCIARCVAELIVEHLEVIDVDDHGTDRCFVSSPFGHSTS